MAFQKKNIYHSHLVAETQDGAIPVLITQEPTKSIKNKDQTYMRFQFANREQVLNLENEACIEACKGFKGQSVLMQAEGQREDARIMLYEYSGAPIKPLPKGQDGWENAPSTPTGGAPAKPAAKPAAPPSAGSGTTAPAAAQKPKKPTQEQAANQLRKLVLQLMNIERAIIGGSNKIAKEFPELTAEDLHGMRGRWYISLERTGIFDDAPIQPLHVKKDGETPKGAAQTEDHPEEPDFSEPEPEPEPEQRAAAKPLAQQESTDETVYDENGLASSDLPF